MCVAGACGRGKGLWLTENRLLVLWPLLATANQRPPQHIITDGGAGVMMDDAASHLLLWMRHRRNPSYDLTAPSYSPVTVSTGGCVCHYGDHGHCSRHHNIS